MSASIKKRLDSASHPFIYNKFHEGSKSNYNNQLINLFTETMKLLIDQSDKFGEKQLNAINQAKEQIINEDFSLCQQPQQSDMTSSISKIIITNKDSVPKSKFGQKYKDKLDVRDQLLTHVFQFQLQIDEDITFYAKAKKSTAYQQLCDEIESYIVDVVENVVSVSFNFLIDGKLKQNESKDYASKNILLNVHSLFKQIIKTLKQYNLIHQSIEKDFIFELTELIDSSLNGALINLSPYYPQSPPTGGTPRMREALLSVDRSGNEEMDFFYTQNIKLTPSVNGDYTQFIMKVINKAIQATSKIDNKDQLQQTLFQKFYSFSQNLFWLSQEDSYASIISGAGPQNKQQINMSRVIIEVKRINFENIVIQYLKNPNSEHSSKVMNLLEIDELKKDKKLEQMKKRHDYAIGQKIPASTKSFSKKDFQDKSFSAKHSAVLRILTKWAQKLQDVFDNPKAHTSNRLYPFKTFSNETTEASQDLKYILYDRLTGKRKKKQKIKEDLIKKYNNFQGSFLSRENSKSLTKSIKRYTETRMIASEMNALLIQFMKQYVNELIRLLVEAGNTEIINNSEDKYYNQLSEKTKSKITKPSGEVIKLQINLVVFRIGDLMRSKIHCSEAAFIRLLKSLYLLDEAEDSPNEPRLFELVRIKNKLDSRDNNILINYLFMGQLQCQLQLSVQKMEGKEQHYYSFAHFLYELTRGHFGVLSECATIISQYDPIASSSTEDFYYKPKPWKKKDKLKSQIVYEVQSQKNQNVKNRTFVCEECGNLKFEQNFTLLKRHKNERQICSKCLISKQRENAKIDLSINQFKVQQFLKNKEISKQLIRHLQNKQIKKINNYKDISDFINQQENQYYYHYRKLSRSSRLMEIQNYGSSIVLELNPKNSQLEWSLVGYIESEFIYFKYRIPHDLRQIKWEVKEEIEFNKYFDSLKNITPLIEKQFKMPEFAYLVSLNNTSQSKINRGTSNFINFDISAIKEVIHILAIKIIIDSLIGSLKNKDQTFSFNFSKEKMQIMNYLTNKDIYNQQQNEYFLQNLQSQNMKLVLRNVQTSWVIKSKSIEDSLNRIEFIFAQAAQIQQLPDWLSKCKKLKILNLSHNYMRTINCKIFIQLIQLNISSNYIAELTNQHLPQSLKKLNASKNELQRVNFKDFLIIAQINLSNNKINSFEEKDVPHSLKRLNISANQLIQIGFFQGFRSLIQLDISNNTNMTAFTIKKSPQLIKLIANNTKCNFLYFHDFPSLTELNISENSQLQTFLISKCPALKILNAPDTKCKNLNFVDLPSLTSLNTSFNSELQYLQVKNCQLLDKINISLNPKCKNIDLINLSAITELDISDYLGLQILSINRLPLLYKLNISDNPKCKILNLIELSSLIELDISNLDELQTFKINNFSLLSTLKATNNKKCRILKIEDFPSLTELNVSENYNIQSLSIKNCPLLKIVWANQNNKLTDLQLQNLPSIKQIHMQLIQLPKCSKTRIININEQNIKYYGSLGSIQYLKRQYPFIEGLIQQ